MKLVIRIFALSVVVAGIAAAGFSPKSAPALSSHLSATGSMPIPTCGPRMPGCTNNGLNR